MSISSFGLTSLHYDITDSNYYIISKTNTNFRQVTRIPMMKHVKYILPEGRSPGARTLSWVVEMKDFPAMAARSISTSTHKGSD
jgi:hypothetical protein